MKHLKKKFIRAWQANQELINVFDSVSINDNEAAKVFVNKNAGKLTGFIRTLENEMIQGFEYRRGNRFDIIPEPNPVASYFEMARQFAKHTHADKKNLFEHLDAEQTNAYTILGALNRYFASSTISATFLFISIEAFINLKISGSISYPFKKRNGEVVMLNKKQIVETLPFNIKVKEVMYLSCNKAFHIDHSHKFEEIVRLKNLRDEIVHTKVSEEKMLQYSPLIIQLLEFNFDSTLLIIQEFINYYEPNLIEECNCGKDF